MYNRNLNDLLREFMNEDLFSSSFTEFRLPKLRYNNDVNKTVRGVGYMYTPPK